MLLMSNESQAFVKEAAVPKRLYLSETIAERRPQQEMTQEPRRAERRRRERNSQRTKAAITHNARATAELHNHIIFPTSKKRKDCMLHDNEITIVRIELNSSKGHNDRDESELAKNDKGTDPLPSSSHPKAVG